MSRFVKRNAEGQVVATAISPQAGWPLEELQDNHPDLVAFLDPPKSYAVRRREEYNRRGVTIEAIAEALIEHAGSRPQKLQALMTIRDEVRAQIPKDVP